MRKPGEARDASVDGRNDRGFAQIACGELLRGQRAKQLRFQALDVANGFPGLRCLLDRSIQLRLRAAFVRTRLVHLLRGGEAFGVQRLESLARVVRQRQLLARAFHLMCRRLCARTL